MSLQERRCNAEGFGRPKTFFFLFEEHTELQEQTVEFETDALMRERLAIRSYKERLQRERQPQKQWQKKPRHHEQER